MKTKKQIESKLREATMRLELVERDFRRYDNIDDYRAIPVIQAEINILTWVLGR